MSTTTTKEENPSDDDSTDDADEVEKEVTVIAYSRPDETFNNGGSKRDFLDTAVPSVDWYEQSERTSTNRFLVLGDEDDPDGQHRMEVGRSEYEELNEKIANDAIDTGNVVRTEKKETTERSHVHGTYAGGRKFLKAVLSADLPNSVISDVLGETLSKAEHRSHISYDDNGDGIVEINAAKDRSKVLVHQERRTDENRYEDEDRVRCMQVTLSFGPAPEAAVEELSENLTEQVHKALNGLDWVRKVRVASCTVSREGDCFV